MVEASDRAGLDLSADLFLREVRKSGCTLGFTNVVVAGSGGWIEEPYARQLHSSCDWPATMAGAGSWDHMRAIAQFGVGYEERQGKNICPAFATIRAISIASVSSARPSRDQRYASEHPAVRRRPAAHCQNGGAP